jgi:RNA polymerase sigma-70 factor (ECF subfamily)
MSEETDTKDLLALHRRLLDGDRVASEELVEVLLGHLVNEMTRKFRRTDVHLLSDGVTDALLEYCLKPRAFDAGRGVPLDRFLAKAAWRNIANSLRGERRRQIRERKSLQLSDEKVVELQPTMGNPIQNEPENLQQQLDEIRRSLENPTDGEILDLRVMGERRTEPFAKVMGISHLPIDQQRREVKRAKDRIDKVLRRRKQPQK